MKLQVRPAMRTTDKLLKSELSKGIAEESEHAGTFAKIREHVSKTGKVPADKVIQQWIAEEHIAKNKHYYTQLEKVDERG